MPRKPPMTVLRWPGWSRAAASHRPESARLPILRTRAGNRSRKMMAVYITHRVGSDSRLDSLCRWAAEQAEREVSRAVAAVRDDPRKGHANPAISATIFLQTFSGELPAMSASFARTSDAFGLTARQQEEAALGTLRDAYALVGKGMEVWRALSEAGEGGICAEYARRLVRRVIGSHDIPGWESHRHVTRADRLRALAAACVLAGGSPPPKGGWRVTTTKRGDSK